MKQLITLLFFVFIVNSIVASTPPESIIDGISIKNSILYRPNDFIDEEVNHSDLILTGKKGRKITSPVSGTITRCNYSYLTNLSKSCSFRTKQTHFNNDRPIRDSLALVYYKKRKQHIDPRFIHVRISIKSPQYGTIHIRGIRNPSQFKTGQTVSKGEVLGELGYSYHKINEPSLLIGRSQDGKTAADPMAIFGLPSTIKHHVALQNKQTLTPLEMTHDLQILQQCINEGYPGINDYISSESLSSLYASVESKLTTSLSKEAFSSQIERILHGFRDNHFQMIEKEEQCRAQANVELYFGVQSDSLIVIRALNSHKQYLGRRIITIDGKPIEALIKEIKPMIVTRADGYNESLIDYEILTVFWSYYKRRYNKKRGSAIEFQFANGETFRTHYAMHSIGDYTRFVRPWASNGQYKTSVLNDSTALLDLNTFKLYEKSKDEIAAFITEIDKANIKNLVIDVRNNSGGSQESLKQLFSYFAESPFQTESELNVKSNGIANFAQYTSNLLRDEPFFPEYTHRKNNRYYLPDSLIEKYSPHPTTHYSGNVYILTNGNSFSAAALLAALLKKQKRGIIIGQETGGNYCHLNALNYANITLPNSGIAIRMPLVQICFDKKDNNINQFGRGVLPDIHIPLTYLDFKEREDLFLKKALQYIH